MPVLIRAATPADLPAITAIYEHAVRHGTATFEIEPPDGAEMKRRMEALLAGGFPYLVAEDDGADQYPPDNADGVLEKVR